jgi:hypothetical protein
VFGCNKKPRLEADSYSSALWKQARFETIRFVVTTSFRLPYELTRRMCIAERYWKD